jgi:WD40 repeat protein
MAPSGGQNNRLKVWRLSDGVLLIDKTVNYSLYALEFSPNGQLLASAGDGQVILWQVSPTDLTVVRTLQRSYPRDMAFSPDGTVIVVATAQVWDGTSGLAAWDVSSGALLRSTTTSLPAEGVAVSADGRTVASSHGVLEYSASPWYSTSRLNEVKLWRMSDFSLLRSYDEETSCWAVKSVAFTHDARSFVYGRYDGTVVMAHNPYPPVGDVAGTVTADGLPLVGVPVDLAASGGHAQSDLTGPDGSFSFLGVPFGPATVSISVPTGYLPLEPASGSAGIVVSAGGTTTQNFTLTGHGSIAGVVTGDGAPMAGVVVSVSGTGSYTASQSSGPEGTYEFSGVPSGPATVSVAVPAGYEVLDPSGGSAEVQVIPAQTTAQDFALAHLRATVAGAVVADCPAAGTPVESVVVEVRDAATSVLAGTATTGPDGGYSISNLDAGAYVVSITVPVGYILEADHVPVVVPGETGSVVLCPCSHRS